MKVVGIYCLAQKELFELPMPEKVGFERGDMVIFSDKDKKEEAGKVLYLDRSADEEEKVLKESAVLRKMTPNDVQKMETNINRGQDVVEPTLKKIEKYGLDMQLFEASYSFDGSKINFIFTADDRVDFRELVKDLAKHFQKQIHLKQIGPRDKARVVSGVGRCGRKLCCSAFLNRMESITMDMVRSQDLVSKGSSKLSGSCGKLLCCLKYEVEEYARLRSELPPMGSIVKTKDVEGRVIGLDVLNQKMKLAVGDRNVIIAKAKDVKNVIVMEERDRGLKPQEEIVPEEASEEELILKE
ncbi:MAG: regulatory iron-sulfur-containing complex subunit RicT [Patescibacteria group bacterium]|nr:stage 0 sporulation protein [Patescibacteria group bacterium]